MQTRMLSLIEALFNTFIGLCIASVATMVICHAYHIPMSLKSNFILTFWMTIVSVIRGYVLRRLFNSEFWKGLRWKILDTNWKEQSFQKTQEPSVTALSNVESGT